MPPVLLGENAVSLTDDEASRLEELIATISEARGSLRPSERGFFDDVEARYSEQGASMYLSARQWQWLSDIADRL